MAPQLALVFDDGYVEEYREYRSFVDERDVPFSLAITPGRLGDEGHLTVEQLRDLTATGCDVLAHGRHHRYLQAHRLDGGVEAGERTIEVAIDHVFPDKPHGVRPGDTFEITDGTQTETRTLVEKGDRGGNGSSDGTATLTFDTALESTYDEGVVRPSETQLTDEIQGVRTALRDRGFEPTGFAFPYDAADGRAWRRARQHYDVIVNAATRSLPNPAGMPLTELRRFYFETTALTRAGLLDYLDTLVDTGGLGILAGHSQFNTVTPERVSFVIDAARERGVELTTIGHCASAGGTVGRER